MSSDFKHEVANRYKTPLNDERRTYEYVLRDEPSETYLSKGLYYLSPIFEGVGTASWHLDFDDGYVDFNQKVMIRLDKELMSKMRPHGKLPAKLMPEFYEARLAADLRRVTPNSL